MKLVRYGPPHQEKPGIIDSEGRIRALHPLIEDFHCDQLAPDALAQLASLDPEKFPLVPGRPRFGVPVAGIRQIIAVGANYPDHCAEGGIEVPKDPLVFAKGVGSLCGCEDPLVVPRSAQALDWEVELALLIGTPGRDIAAEDALDHVAGYCTAIDFSERDWMLKFGFQLQQGKSLDTFTPLGPWFVSADEVPDPQALGLWLEVNGVRRQNGATRDMVFSVRDIIAWVSRFQTLLPGDVIVTGTPGGIGHCMVPPVYLQIGDRVTCGVSGLGDQAHDVVERSEAGARAQRASARTA